MTGLGVVMGNDRAPHDTFMQVGGTGLRISATKLREADDQSRTLHRIAAWRMRIPFWCRPRRPHSPMD